MKWDSLREAILGLTLGILRYNGGAWMYPQNAPPALFSQPSYSYFVPMPAPFGAQQWSTPSYDLWSDSRGRSYENYSKGERQSFAENGKERAQNETETSNFILKSAKDVIPIKVQTPVVTNTDPWALICRKRI